ncbi:MAG TPA: tRNA (N6-threonylcarbamoyladenosine(37)-N6)-methyltransferase TrmO [Dehalococcoidia bacterium]|nr:tRNA (N6-threonylcarbamoyladenosine(37)-N6)-methyltransferase TrmO [Dehalococcoidia bacterium]
MKKDKDISEMKLRPVGIVKSDVREPSLVVKSGDLDRRGVLGDVRKSQSRISQILIYDDYAGILDGIEDFSHILVLYWAHLTSLEGRSLIKVHPMGRKDMPEVGIFATCSPARPNPICVAAVPLLEHKGNTLKVRGLDAVDGSPLIDIKPYTPRSYSVSEAEVAGWMRRIVKELTEAADQG